MKLKIIFFLAGLLTTGVSLLYCFNGQINYQLHWTFLSLVCYLFVGFVYLKEVKMEESKVSTAEIIIREEFSEGEFDELMGYMNNSIEPSIVSAMRKFAKIHVKAALERVNDKVQLESREYSIYGGKLIKKENLGEEINLEGQKYIGISEDSILNAYPETLIQ